MIVWRRVRALVVCLVAGTGCWEEQQVDDVFSEDEWAYLQTFQIDRLPRPAYREDLARVGQQLFFDPAYSGPIVNTNANGAKDDLGKVSCALCHDPAKSFSDDKSLSIGTNVTKRNTPGLIDLAYRGQFTWSGEFTTIDDVLDLALRSSAAMNDPTHANLIREVLARYVPRYPELFPDREPEQIYAVAKRALGDYQRALVAGPSRFDLYLRGEGTLGDDEKRGAKLFIGKALCSECHDGPLFADDKFHNTGVEQLPTPDPGRVAITSSPIDEGRFRTPTLRHIAKTGPYMHAGQLATLTEVIEFYRWGGDVNGFAGVKDPRIIPLELTDDEVRDLESFLMTLTGEPVAETWTTKPVLP